MDPIEPKELRQIISLVFWDRDEDTHYDITENMPAGAEFVVGDQVSISLSDAPTRMYTVKQTDRRERIDDDGVFWREWIVYVSVSALLAD